MSKMSPILKPLNRHLVIIPHPDKRRDESSTVLLPEDYKQEESRFITATVLDVSPDCNSSIQKIRSMHHGERCVVVVERSMVEEIQINNKSYYTVLENYVLGILRGAHEDTLI